MDCVGVSKMDGEIRSEITEFVVEGLSDDKSVCKIDGSKNHESAI